MQTVLKSEEYCQRSPSYWLFTEVVSASYFGKRLCFVASFMGQNTYFIEPVSELICWFIIAHVVELINTHL